MVLCIFGEFSIGFDPPLHDRLSSLMVDQLSTLVLTLSLLYSLLREVQYNILIIIWTLSLLFCLFVNPSVFLSQCFYQLSAFGSRQPLVGDPEASILPFCIFSPFELMIEIDTMIPLIPSQTLRSLYFLRTLNGLALQRILSLSQTISTLLKLQPQLTNIGQQAVNIPRASIETIDLSFCLNDLIFLPFVTLPQRLKLIPIYRVAQSLRAQLPNRLHFFTCPIAFGIQFLQTRKDEIMPGPQHGRDSLIVTLLQIFADGILHFFEIGLDERNVIQFMVPPLHA